MSKIFCIFAQYKFKKQIMSTGLIIGICIAAVAAALYLQFRKRKVKGINKCLAYYNNSDPIIAFNIWRYVNIYRIKKELPPFKQSSLLSKHASKRSVQISKFNKPSHYGIGKVRESINAECQTEAISEVLAPNWEASKFNEKEKFAESVVNAWINSPEHEKVLTNGHKYWGSGLHGKGKKIFVVGFTAH